MLKMGSIADEQIENGKLLNKIKSQLESFYFKSDLTRDMLDASPYMVLQFVIQPATSITYGRNVRLNMNERK